MDEDNERITPDLENNETGTGPVNEADRNEYYIKERICRTLACIWKQLVAILTPIVFLFIIHPSYKQYQWCAYTLVIMAVYWVTECIPLAVTSFLPLIIFPLAGVMSSAETASCYFNDTLIMFYGSLVLAAAIEQSGLHKRLAYRAIRMVGYSHYKLLFALSFITMFISMWITNTAATTMMVPIIFALLKVFEEQNLLTIYERNTQGELVASDITTCYFCAATFSATIGGIGTLVGTGTNLVFKGLFESTYSKAPEYLSFPLFSAFAIPLMILLEISCYLCMICMYLGFLRPHSKAAQFANIPPKGVEAAKETVERNSKALGPFSYWEIMVTILFSGAMILFFSRSPGIFPGWADRLTAYFQVSEKKYVLDSAVALIVCSIMLVINRNWDIIQNFTAKTYGELPHGRIPSVLNWTLLDEKTPYSFMFLLGGGFALSTAANKNHSNLNGVIGDFLSTLAGLPELFIIFIIIAFTIFITNFASNVAVANVVVPIAMTLAERLEKHPLPYNIAAGYSASFCYMLPVGTPGNLVVQSAANIPTQKMMIAGVGPTVTTLLLTWLAVGFWSPVIWPDLRHGYPEWINKTENIVYFY